MLEQLVQKAEMAVKVILVNKVKLVLKEPVV